jgi:signal transduction histidine kinase
MSTEAARARLLIVDDDPALLDALAEAVALRIPGVRTETCDSAARALERVAASDFDAIVSDIKMPGMDGIELLGRLQALVPDTPVVLITGHGQTDLAIQALRASAFDLIQKPLDREYMVAAINRAIETSALKREVKAQRDALIEYSQTLEQRVQERTAELEQALRAKDEFLGLVSHELRNPMTVILGNAEALYRYGDNLPAEEKTLALEDLRQGTRRLMQLIENLLVLAKLEYGIHEMEPVRVEKLISQQSEWHRQFSPARELQVELEDAPSVIVCNSTHVELVLNNLLSNADKYGRSGEATVLLARRAGDEYVISIRDRGAGIPAEERDLVFQPFYRSKSASNVRGMGIGLAVSKKLVELNGGRIWLADRPGGGTEFSFSLPLATIEDGVPGAAAEPVASGA